MKTLKLTALILGCCLCLRGATYTSHEKIISPARHFWHFTDKEVGDILIKHLKSIGTNVPTGAMYVQGIERPMNYADNPTITLVVSE